MKIHHASRRGLIAALVLLAGAAAASALSVSRSSAALAYSAVAAQKAPAAEHRPRPPSERPCSQPERDAGDAALDLTTGEQRAAIAQHLPWGAPIANGPTTNEHVLAARDFVNDYDGDLRVPLWSAERIVAAEQMDKLPQRIRCFRPDPRITAIDDNQNARLADYLEPIYDQGHMTPAADQERSIPAQVNTFLLTNMAPQTCQFNRGIWQILEAITRRWANQHPTIYVFSGSVFDRDGNGVRDRDASAQHMLSNNRQQRVAVPSAFYKIVAFQDRGGPIQTISILMPHDTANPEGDAARRYLEAHITTIAAIERVTGLDLFPNASGIQEASTLWSFPGTMPGTLCHVRPAASPRARPSRGSRTR